MNMCEYSNDLAKMVYKSFCFVAHVVVIAIIPSGSSCKFT